MTGPGSFAGGLSLPELALVLILALVVGGMALKTAGWLARNVLAVFVGLLLLYFLFRLVR
jgi:hypothetical protein